MPSNFLTPFLELDEEFCKIPSLDLTDGHTVSAHRQRLLGFQRRHSLCPVTLPNSKFNSGPLEPAEPAGWPLSSGGQTWSRDFQQQLPCSSLNHIPFRVDRSVSMIEGSVGSLGGSSEHQLPPPPPLLPPPGLSLSSGFLSSSKCLTPTPTPPLSTRYKTELCRTYEESGTCKYGSKCQFAHGMDEVRGLNRHPKYKTEPCRTFHTIGFCPYGSRCHFVHEEQNPAPGPQPPRARERPQLLRHSISFAGFSSSSSSSSSPAFPPQLLTGFQPLHDPLLFSRASSVSPPPSTGSPEPLSPLLAEPAAFRQSYPFCSDLDQLGTPRFYAALTDSLSPSKSQAMCRGPGVQGAHKCPIQLQNHQNNQSLNQQSLNQQSLNQQSLNQQSLNQQILNQQILNQQSLNQQIQRQASLPGQPALHRCSSAESLTDLEGYSSSSSLSGSESPSFEGRRLPIFSRLSVSDD